MLKAFFIVRVYLIVFCVVSFFSCTKDLDIVLNEQDRQLIINSTFNVKERFNVRLTTSRNVLDPSSGIESVSDAYVSIKDGDGKLLEVLRERNGQGVYWSSEKLTAFPGEMYSLEVSHPRWKGTVFTATTIVPQLGSESILDTNVVVLSDAPALQIAALIDDGSKKGDKYIFEVELEPEGVLSTLAGFGNDVTVYGDQESPRRLFISDDGFNGQKKSLDFISKSGLPTDTIGSKKSTVIRMLGASKEYYEYFRSLEEYEVAQNSIGSINTSAVKIYSNIKQSGVNKGFGIFAAYNEKTLRIEY